MQYDFAQKNFFAPLPKALPSLQPIFTRRTSGQCLGKFTDEKFSSPPPPLNIMSLAVLTQLSLSLSLFDFKGLTVLLQQHERMITYGGPEII
jgi:hypothetical protein